MKPFFKKAVAATLAIAFTAAAMPAMSTSAEAGHRYSRSHGYYGDGYYGDRYYGDRYYAPRQNYYRKKHRRDRNRAAVAGIAGLAIGTIIGSAIAQPRYNPPATYYRPYRSTSYGPQPWTGEWYAYCARKYRSFDARSGTFQPYHGPRRLCQ